jgi:TRAP-type C4-dicarboxylate transport system substrate-binding protein
MARLPGILGCAVLAWLALAVSAGAADVTLRFGCINAKGTVSYDNLLEPFARGLEAKSDGRITVDLKPMGGFGKPVELYPMVESGNLEIAATVQSYQIGQFPRTSVMELPLMFDSAESGSETLWKLFQEGQLGHEYDAVKVLALYVSPPFGLFASADTKVAGLRDLRGLRLRTPGITIGLALSRIGVIPIGLPVNMIGSMLNDKLIDGMAFGWDVAYTTSTIGGKLIIDQVAYLIDANLAAPALMIVMNKKVYEGMPPDLRAVVDGLSGLPLVLQSARLRDESELKAKQRAASSATHHVVKFTDAERQELKQRIAPVYDEWVAEMTRQGIDGAALLARARALAAHS